MFFCLFWFNFWIDFYVVRIIQTAHAYNFCDIRETSFTCTFCCHLFPGTFVQIEEATWAWLALPTWVTFCTIANERESALSCCKSTTHAPFFVRASNHYTLQSRDFICSHMWISFSQKEMSKSGRETKNKSQISSSRCERLIWDKSERTNARRASEGRKRKYTKKSWSVGLVDLAMKTELPVRFYYLSVAVSENKERRMRVTKRWFEYISFNILFFLLNGCVKEGFARSVGS